MRMLLQITSFRITIAPLIALAIVGCSSSTIEFRRFPRATQLADIRNTVKDKEIEITLSSKAGLPKRNYVGFITVLREDSTVVKDTAAHEEIHLSTAHVQSIYCGSCSRSYYAIPILTGILAGYIVGGALAGADNESTGKTIGSLAGGTAGLIIGAAEHQPTTTWMFYNVRDHEP